MLKLAVMGDPIEHSLSPTIHKHFASQFNHDITYHKLKVTQQDLKKETDRFFYDGHGLNLTSPLKQAGISIVQNLTKRAIEAKAVNTLFLKEKELWGDNTDGLGFINSVKNRTILKNSKVLILGAGGASYGILPYLVKKQVSSIHIINRTLENAKTLLSPYKEKVIVSCSDFSSALDGGFDLIVYTLPRMSKVNDFSNLKINLDKSICVDINYGNKSDFLIWAKNKKAKTKIDGVEMLIEQGAIGYQLWTGEKPDSALTLTYIRNLF